MLVWVYLIPKDYFFGVVISGGPVLAPLACLPVAVG